MPVLFLFQLSVFRLLFVCLSIVNPINAVLFTHLRVHLFAHLFFSCFAGPLLGISVLLFLLLFAASFYFPVFPVGLTISRLCLSAFSAVGF